MKNTCQSCGMPLVRGKLDKRGTNLDKTRSDVYCNYCYLNGKFQQPNLTVDEMINIGIKGIEESKSNKFSKYIYKKLYPSMVRKLKRWN